MLVALCRALSPISPSPTTKTHMHFGFGPFHPIPSPSLLQDHIRKSAGFYLPPTPMPPFSHPFLQ